MDDVLCRIERKNKLMNDECMMYNVSFMFCLTDRISRNLSPDVIISMSRSLSCKTHLQSLAIERCLLVIQVQSLMYHGSRNRCAYKLHKSVRADSSSLDISSCKLWCAILLLMEKNYASALKIVNNVLSSIPPYAMYQSGNLNQTSNTSKKLYVDMFLNSDTTVMQRAKNAWLFDMKFSKDMINRVPLAIQIELYFSDFYLEVSLSPLICTYYLQFLWYHKMCQYDNRHRALQQLVDEVNNEEIRLGYLPHLCLNITGHCLLLAGERDYAQDIFYASYTLTQRHPPYDKYSSALWYLLNCNKKSH